MQGFVPDAAQWQAASALDACHDALSKALPATTGVYLWGPVGRGKTWLLDAFHRALTVPARRQHFHRFMRWVHQRLFQLTGTADPLHVLAAELAADVRVLCLDELFVSDIGDALLLGRLLQALFAQGVVLVTTSNQPPRQLYADGFNRQRFLPAIEAIEAHMQIRAVDGGQDHRLHDSPRVQRYFVRTPGQPAQLEGVFAAQARGQCLHRGALRLGSRHIDTVCHTATLLWCRFDALCVAPLSALDFIFLCDRFQAIFLSDVPALGGVPREGRIARGTEDAAQQVAAGERVLPALARHDDSVRRFIALVDECYDRQVPLYLEARVALDALYTEGHLAFAFRRSYSRLQEMQRARFPSRT